MRTRGLQLAFYGRNGKIPRQTVVWGTSYAVGLPYAGRETMAVIRAVNKMTRAGMPESVRIA